MEKFLIKLIFALAFVSCGSREGGGRECICLPEIVIETQRDTLRVGDEYVAKISLSDESFLFVKNHKGEKRAILPVFKINGEIVETEESYLIHKEMVTLDNVNTTVNGTWFKEWTSSIVFPYPGWGDVELS